MRDGIRAELPALPGTDAVPELTTLLQGPREALVAAKADFRDRATAAEIEWACERAEQRLRERFPLVRRVCLDPTPGLGRRPSPGPAPGP